MKKYSKPTMKKHAELRSITFSAHEDEVARAADRAREGGVDFNSWGRKNIPDFPGDKTSADEMNKYSKQWADFLTSEYGEPAGNWYYDDDGNKVINIL